MTDLKQRSWMPSVFGLAVKAAVVASLAILAYDQIRPHVVSWAYDAFLPEPSGRPSSLSSGGPGRPFTGGPFGRRLACSPGGGRNEQPTARLPKEASESL